MDDATADSETEIPLKVSLVERLRLEFSFVKGNFKILVLSWILVDFAREIPSTYYGLYVRALGGSAATVGFISFVSMITQSLVQLPGGYLADKYGRKMLISTMTFGVAVSYLFYAIATSWHMILFGAILNSLCMIYGPALNAIVADSVPKERRGMGFSIMNLINSVSTTPAPLIAGWLFTRMGLIPSMRLGYGIFAGAFFVAGIIRFRLTETLSEPERIDIKELVDIYPKSISQGVQVWSHLPRSAFALFVINVVSMFSLNIFLPIMLFWIVDDLGISELNWSYILTGMFVSMILLAIPIGKAIDKYGKKRLLIVAYLVWLAIIPMFLWGNFHILLMGTPLIGVLQIAMMASSSALFADLVPSEHRGKVSGITGFFTNIAMALGQLAGGMMYDNFSHSLPWIVQVVFIIPILVIIILYIDEPQKEREESQ